MSNERAAQGEVSYAQAVSLHPAISRQLLQILACQIDRSLVSVVEDCLICEAQGDKYRIDDGIPVVLLDEVER